MMTFKFKIPRQREKSSSKSFLLTEKRLTKCRIRHQGARFCRPVSAPCSYGNRGGSKTDAGFVEYLQRCLEVSSGSGGVISGGDTQKVVYCHREDIYVLHLMMAEVMGSIPSLCDYRHM